MRNASTLKNLFFRANYVDEIGASRTENQSRSGNSRGFVTLEEGRVATEQPCRSKDGRRKTKRWQEDTHEVEEDLVRVDPKSRRTPRASARPRRRNEEADDYDEREGAIAQPTIYIEYITRICDRLIGYNG